MTPAAILIPATIAASLALMVAVIKAQLTAARGHGELVWHGKPEIDEEHRVTYRLAKAELMWAVNAETWLFLELVFGDMRVARRVLDDRYDGCHDDVDSSTATFSPAVSGLSAFARSYLAGIRKAQRRGRRA